MDKVFQQTLSKNFSAAIDMFNNAVDLCPALLWQPGSKFYYMSYHTAIFLDYYLTIPARDFHPQLPYTLVDPGNLPEGAIDDVLPSRFYSKDELHDYVTRSRIKCKKLISETPIGNFSKRWISDDEVNLHGLCPPLVVHYNVAEILFYNFRHVQHHVGQLNLLLRQHGDTATPWISQAD